ncbi:SDR family oxidoreductase [Nostocaceae cyanobacterium CENA357]|uniref:SDR family oxidoreductase n=1 Tax=Atlanticothrix silvestris CENA357 TaxID=1725252 RepID=A0A8J7KYU7_9CYAN|nr:SDR family oxidoreductase [Atlanticothrix silvestris]MBH8552695.1 SDR family oxidoreductase [Atlanticothrix silvestris CENA357]
MSPTVLITGASQGIGKATALLFARKGYDLILAARQAERLEATAQEIQSFGHPAPLTVACDVTNPSQVQALVKKALEHYGSIDVLVNNAGIFASGPVEEFSIDDWHHIIDTNLWGYIHTIHALLPHFVQRRTGTIVNLSSIGGKVPTAYLVPYCTSKFGVTGLTEALQAELQSKGIHVCGIYPNLIKSSLMERAVFRDKNEQDIQIRRKQLDNVLKNPVVEKPEDVANAIWDAVKNKKSEVMVGSANFSQIFYRLFPGLTKWISRQTLKNEDN